MDNLAGAGPECRLLAVIFVSLTLAVFFSLTAFIPSLGIPEIVSLIYITYKGHEQSSHGEGILPKRKTDHISKPRPAAQVFKAKFEV